MATEKFIVYKDKKRATSRMLPVLNTTDTGKISLSCEGIRSLSDYDKTLDSVISDCSSEFDLSPDYQGSRLFFDNITEIKDENKSKIPQVVIDRRWLLGRYDDNSVGLLLIFRSKYFIPEGIPKDDVVSDYDNSMADAKLHSLELNLSSADICNVRNFMEFHRDVDDILTYTFFPHGQRFEVYVDTEMCVEDEINKFFPRNFMPVEFQKGAGDILSSIILNIKANAYFLDTKMELASHETEPFAYVVRSPGIINPRYHGLRSVEEPNLLGYERQWLCGCTDSGDLLLRMSSFYEEGSFSSLNKPALPDVFEVKFLLGNASYLVGHYDFYWSLEPLTSLRFERNYDDRYCETMVKSSGSEINLSNNARLDDVGMLVKTIADYAVSCSKKEKI